MAGRRGGKGPGALAMGGPGVRPKAPPTPMAGAGAGAAMSGAGGPGAGPMGLKKGGHVSKEKREEATEKKEKRHEKLAKGGIVGGSDAKGRERHAGKVS